ncbi:hypothetical protein V7I75_24025 [Pseudomonas aeruginosa]|uniref:hypothetical protein n=1 Tax=Pseudomonas aeruginosa TaxID=287 RepID=UPI0003B9CB64|nr:hypothetical protein [Pseudomonas aeruginosa]HCL2813516.1 hypothetical protein [Pseudomonas aeruginosa 7D9A]ASA30042.1 hypothetical protein CDG41_18230 [Pseudomonas aeruginosa]ASD04215.1 hypothetical protein CD797_17625 [Pseudomonas aeruginosa]AVE32290.1 hypothetical protein HV91_08935 [Pseudomonas aeruginosa]EIU1490530.1 hypothetical protein [Pseudomonas aeruginosa]
MFEDDEITQQREEASRLKQRQRADDVKSQMATLSGRRFVWDLLGYTRYEGRSTLFDTHGGRQSYLLGAYEVGRKLSEEIRTLCPEQYLLMVRENSKQPDEVTQ